MSSQAILLGHSRLASLLCLLLGINPAAVGAFKFPLPIIAMGVFGKGAGGAGQLKVEPAIAGKWLVKPIFEGNQTQYEDVHRRQRFMICHHPFRDFDHLVGRCQFKRHAMINNRKLLLFSVRNDHVFCHF